MNSGFLCAEITDLNLPEAVRALLDSFSGDLLRRCDNPGLSAAIAEVNRGRYHVTAMAGLRRGSWLAVKDAVRAAKNASGWDCKEPLLYDCFKVFKMSAAPGYALVLKFQDNPAARFFTALYEHLKPLHDSPRDRWTPHVTLRYLAPHLVVDPEPLNAALRDCAGEARGPTLGALQYSESPDSETVFRSKPIGADGWWNLVPGPRARTRDSRSHFRFLAGVAIAASVLGWIWSWWRQRAD